MLSAVLKIKDVSIFQHSFDKSDEQIKIIEDFANNALQKNIEASVSLLIHANPDQKQ